MLDFGDDITVEATYDLPVVDLSLHERQTEAFTTDATELLYGGATYGGKSHLMRVAAIVWCVQIPGLQVYLFRREFPDLYKNHMEGPTSFPALLRAWVQSGHAKVNYGKNSVEFWNGSKIHLCHCQYDKDVTSFDGAEIHVLMIDELTHFTEYAYRYLRGRCRLGGLVVPEQFRGLFPRVLCGSNPGGIGHNWVRRFFIKLQPPYAKQRMPPEEGGFVRQFIPALAADNPTGMANDPNYMANQAGLGDPALVRAKRDGDWNIVAGGAFDDVWTERVIIPRFRIPSSWYVDRGFDWGSTHPFSVLWFAECDGTEALISQGPGKAPRRFAPPPGSLIVIDEFYGCQPDQINKGLKWGAVRIARAIKECEEALLEQKWVAVRPEPGPADNQIAAGVDPGHPTIKKQMADEDVEWLESNKTPGSRKIGFELVRAGFAEAGKDYPEKPCIYVMEHCRELISHIPILPRAVLRSSEKVPTDDVDSAAEDHDYDVLRYRRLHKRAMTSVAPLKI